MAKERKKKKNELPPGVRERDGRYTYRYSVPVIVNGKKTRKQKETKSYSTAKAAYAAGILIEADKQRGKLVDEKNISLEKWTERWLEDYIIEREPRKHTVRNKKTSINSILRHLGADTKVKDITGDDYQQWLNTLKKKGRTEGTIKDYHSDASMIFADAVRKNIIGIDPAEGARIPAFKQTLEEIEAGEGSLPKYLEKDQLKHFLNFVRFRGYAQDYAMFVVLAYTGLRIGELLALKVSDFNEEERYVSVTKTLTVTGSVKDYELGPPKNTSSIRKVSIGDTVIKTIRSQLAWRAQKEKNGEVLHDAGFLFWSIKYPGYPGSAISIESRFSRLLEAAELPSSLTPHSLRHTHVTLLAEAGEQLAVIQDRLGHKNDDITRRIYLHVTEGQKKLVPDRFERVMNS
ncbi:site-specific integrase [Paenibacillus dendritiformis]|uniref:tyrosine-type recombinase/integrase n=1 Tax=Paenibacillus dendritiformis TaxID=130049 RepID=UPI001B108E65|nr:tyrosine-type recombinase/integrase [Paenibacillus dendritiformis]GIO76243.1 site-specific integrase [Paenibacillus dendritiformis]